MLLQHAYVPCCVFVEQFYGVCLAKHLIWVNDLTLLDNVIVSKERKREERRGRRDGRKERRRVETERDEKKRKAFSHGAHMQAHSHAPLAHMRTHTHTQTRCLTHTHLLMYLLRLAASCLLYT